VAISLVQPAASVADAGRAGSTSPWWTTRAFVAAMAALIVVPLLWPTLPPLVDLPGHLGRYRIQLDLNSSVELQRYFSFQWSLIGNLGVDLLLLPLAPLVGLELAVKLIVLSIPALTLLGMFWVAHEVHGRIPPTALFALPLVYNQPFNYGFLNFSLAMALALIAFALWLSLTRRSAFRTRAAVFVPLSALLWLVHAFGWGALGLMVFATEVARNRERGSSWAGSTLHACTQVSVLVLPALLTLIWRSGAGGDNDNFFDAPFKIYGLASALRDRWQVWDLLGVLMLTLLLVSAVIDKHLSFSPKLAWAAVALTLGFVALPRTLFGSVFADLRLAPFVLMIFVLALRPTSDDRIALNRLACLGLAFFVLRLVGNTASFAIAHVESEERLGALSHIDRGAAVLTLAGAVCDVEWELPRHGHLGGLVIARRRGFSNDQWEVPGAQPLRVHYTAADPFRVDPSKDVFSNECLAKLAAPSPNSAVKLKSAEHGISDFPRQAFDYVWLIRPEDFAAGPRPGLDLIWRGRDSLLYRVRKEPVPGPRS
jgi:hypothetical protein